MKKYLIAFAFLFILPCFLSAASSNNTNSWIKIEEPQPGIYVNGEKVLNSKMYIFIGSNSINVVADASSNVRVAYFAIYDVMKKDMVEGVWDYDRSDGFSYNFTSSPLGIYAIAAIGASIDIQEPVAFDWIMPVIIIHV